MDLLINALCITVGIMAGLILTIILFFKITIWIFGTRAKKRMKKTNPKTAPPKERIKIDNKRD